MKWVLLQSDDRAVSKLADDMGVNPVIATLLANRGIDTPAAARSFLSNGISDLSDPGLFLHMERAVRRIKAAISHREQIVVYGDYDVDGVTGSALLYLALRGAGADVRSYIPDRLTEGYGLNAGALRQLKASGAGLVIAVDCGITAHQEAAYARSIGLDLIITDHHEFSRNEEQRPYAVPSVPEAEAVLHPLLLNPDVPETARESIGVITGVGVAFKLAQALSGSNKVDEGLAGYLDLVTLGTVADIGRITGENRIMVRHGLDMLSASTGSRPGIEALKQVAGLRGRRITAGTVGFTLAPRINASGRMERADAAFRLLTTDSAEEASLQAQTLENANRERQAVEERITAEAKDQCRAINGGDAGALVLASSEWHPGVIGIVASRIVDAFYRPSALIAIQNGTGKGSARSIPGFDLYRGISACADLLLGYGGHKCAAGFSIEEKNIPAFRERLSDLARKQLGPEGFERTISVDGSVKLGEITLPLMREMEKLAPYGLGNPEPRLGSRGLTVLSTNIVKNNHLKLKLRQGNGISFDAIAFNRADLLGTKIRENALIAAVYTPRMTSWNGTTRIELDIKDVKAER